MKPEASSDRFETSEILATFVASTPLLAESWRLCSLANTTQNRSFLMELIGATGYVAFPSMEMVSSAGWESVCYGDLVALGVENNQLFPPLHRQINEGEEPIMVHNGFLQLFISIYANPSFQSQMLALMEKSKSIVITGHSIGGTTASLTTLWLLSYLASHFSSHLSVLCITFGSPLLGNESLSRTILRERWDGNFCHVVLKHDIMPRLLFTPPRELAPRLQFLLKFWHMCMTSLQFREAAGALHTEQKADIFGFVLGHFENPAQAEEGSARSLFWPFGSYFFCSVEGAICMDNATSVIKMMHLMLKTGSPCSSMEDHLSYGKYVEGVCMQFLKQRSFKDGDLPESCYEAGVALALQSSGIGYEDQVAKPAIDCLMMARRMGRTPNLNLANLAIKLSNINPYRAQIEWYKAVCDESDDQMGYYDSFKKEGNSKRYCKVNMNRVMLGDFWNRVIEMLENNELPHDFHTRNKWVNASQFYKLLVEPLDIAYYYRTGMHLIKGHYIDHGRERRYKIFDRWWEERRFNVEGNCKRSTFASSTQDTCFWAKLEKARDCLANVRNEKDSRKLASLWEYINEFECHAAGLVDAKQVSKDVLARNSSYTLWLEDLRELRSRLMQFPVQFLRFANGEVVP